MKINAHLVKAERVKRAWSQEHLAEVTGLGVRTIHRIEKAGTASPETLKAVAAVLGLDTSVLQETGHIVSVPGRLSWLVPFLKALVRQARMVDRAIVSLKSTHRLLITLGLLLMAFICYFISFSIDYLPGMDLSVVFFIMGAGFEILFWQRIFSHRRKRRHRLAMLRGDLR